MDETALRDLFEPFGPVKVRKMFGGHGIYADDLCFAVQVKGEVFLKADAVSAPLFEAVGCRQWTYDSPGKVTRMPYWRLAEAAYDDPEELARWSRLALEAARRRAALPAKKPARAKPA